MPNQIWMILITQFPSLFNFDSRYSSPLLSSKQSIKKKKLWLKKIRTLQSSKLSFQSLLSPSETEKETLSHIEPTAGFEPFTPDEANSITWIQSDSTAFE